MKLVGQLSFLLLCKLIVCSLQLAVSPWTKAHAQNSAPSGELMTLGAQGPAVTPNDPLNTGPFNCNGYGESGQKVVGYTMPSNMQLRGVLFFPGAWSRVVADIGWKLTDKTTGQVIYWTNWDHYAAQVVDANGQTMGPGGPSIPQQVWFQLPAGTWITLRRGDIVELSVYCSDYSNYGFPVQAHVAATLYGNAF